MAREKYGTPCTGDVSVSAYFQIFGGGGEGSSEASSNRKTGWFFLHILQHLSHFFSMVKKNLEKFDMQFFRSEKKLHDGTTRLPGKFLSTNENHHFLTKALFSFQNMDYINWRESQGFITGPSFFFCFSPLSNGTNIFVFGRLLDCLSPFMAAYFFLTFGYF